MYSGPPYWLLLVAFLAVTQPGCTAPRPGATLTHERAVEYYVDRVDRTAYSVADDTPVAIPSEPRTISDPETQQTWWMPLIEAVHLALQNNRLIRTNNEFLAGGNRLLTNPDTVPSVYDLAIQESGVLVGNRGTSAALSDFDPRLTGSMTWGRDENIQNNLFLSGGLPPGSTLVEESADYSTRIEKVFATGGQIALTNDWNYSLNNSTARLFGSAYTGSVGLEYRHPLWAGTGTEFTQIAGPVGQINERVTGVSQGIIIARINADISATEFEGNVSQLLLDVTQVYWDLYLAYREYEIEKEARDSTEETWKQVKAKFETGIEGGSKAEEAQANEEYLVSKSRTELALAVLWETEGRLRRILGLPASDGRLIRPADEPETEKLHADWNASLAEALTLRTELRRQKASIRSLELQWKAACSLTKPRFDFVAGYSVNGFGDDLIASNDNDGTTAEGLRSATNTLLQGDQTSWDLGFILSFPFGVRAERAQAQNLQLRVVKARAALAAQELEISHELANAFNLLERWHTNAQTNLERQVAADRRVEAFEAEYESGRTALDSLLRARISQAQSRTEYARNIVEYNKALANLEYRRGTLFERCHVHIAERSDAPDEYLASDEREPLESEAPEDFGWSDSLGS